jgi:HPt (histidine-containing phosphotransfer) domain-containing protein
MMTTRSALYAGVPGRLDMATLNSLLHLDQQRPGSIRRLIDLFAGDHGRFLRSARSLLAEADFDALRHGLHTLKGSSGSLGAMRLSALAALAERRAERGDTDGVDASLTALSRELELSCEALRWIFADDPARPD